MKRDEVAFIPCNPVGSIVVPRNMLLPTSSHLSFLPGRLADLTQGPGSRTVIVNCRALYLLLRAKGDMSSEKSGYWPSQEVLILLWDYASKKSRAL